MTNCPVCDAILVSVESEYVFREFCYFGCYAAYCDYHPGVFRVGSVGECIPRRDDEIDPDHPYARGPSEKLLAHAKKLRRQLFADPGRVPFEVAIRQDRYDRATRLVYADWLEEQGHDDEALFQRNWTKERQQAEDWLREFASQAGITCEDYSTNESQWRLITYEDALEAGRLHVDHDGEEWFTQRGDEKARNLLNGDDKERLHEFWRCWEIVTGTNLDGKMIDHWRGGKESIRNSSPFSCSC